MTVTQDILTSAVPDTRDVPFDADVVISDEEYAAIMQRTGIAEGEPGTSVSAFNSSI